MSSWERTSGVLWTFGVSCWASHSAASAHTSPVRGNHAAYTGQLPVPRVGTTHLGCCSPSWMLHIFSATFIFVHPAVHTSASICCSPPFAGTTLDCKDQENTARFVAYFTKSLTPSMVLGTPSKWHRLVAWGHRNMTVEWLLLVFRSPLGQVAFSV